MCFNVGVVWVLLPTLFCYSCEGLYMIHAGTGSEEWKWKGTRWPWSSNCGDHVPRMMLAGGLAAVDVTWCLFPHTSPHFAAAVASYLFLVVRGEIWPYVKDPKTIGNRAARPALISTEVGMFASLWREVTNHCSAGAADERDTLPGNSLLPSLSLPSRCHFYTASIINCARIKCVISS